MIRLYHRITSEQIHDFPQIELRRIWESASIGIHDILVPIKCYGAMVQFFDMKFHGRVLHAELVTDYFKQHSVRLTNDSI